MARYEIADIKADARGHWGSIVERVAGIGDDYLSTTHGECPKCGGGPSADRWRVFDDFAETGGAICNQCGKFGDGLALVQWFTGWGFPSVVEKIGTFLGTVESARGKGLAVAKPSPLADKPKEPAKPVDIDSIATIEIFPDSPITDGTIRMWCMFRRGIDFDAVKSLGAKVGRYRKRHKVIAFPVVNTAGHQVGWTIYESGGRVTLPQFKAGSSEPVAMLKVKTIKAK